MSEQELDRLAALEEERRFLLRSLDDLERERDAGDVDEVDYRSLRDGYTVRAAKVQRQIEAGSAAPAARSPRRVGRVVLISAAVLAVAVAIGFALANAFGERGVNQEITGFDPGNDSRIVLAQARESLRDGDFILSNRLFARVVEMERERDIDSAEAITYFGWTLALQVRAEAPDPGADPRLDAAKVALRQAIEIDPDYADPKCFLSIIEFAFLGDADAALPYVEQCEASNPSAEVSDLVSGFAEEVRAATSES